MRLTAPIAGRAAGVDEESAGDRAMKCHLYCGTKCMYCLHYAADCDCPEVVRVRTEVFA